MVTPESRHEWRDHAWTSARSESAWRHGAVSIYEIHAGSWRRNPDGSVLGYRQLAEQLVPYVSQLGFTHVELLPLSEYPLDESWGYQTTGYFAPTSRYGSGDDLRWFVDHCHQHGIGVILDWTPAHFPKDEHGLAYFDGGPLYEHADPRRADHPDWGTSVFDYGRNEVKNFLLASAVYWFEEFHVDGLRVDAVASMLYWNYSRRDGEWLPNRYGGAENLEAIDFCRELNSVMHANFPGCMVIAEESTDWPLVSRPVYLGGLGFTMKWNMGWMHDILDYMKLDPVYRSHHHHELTFSQMYAFSENFVLPFSHDEVVHCKGTPLSRMPGDRWQQFANLRLLYTYMFTHPGKKLLFMGNELAQYSEWDFRQSLPWELLNDPLHAGINRLVSDLNRLYRDHAALHRYDFEQRGFEWIDCHDAGNSVLAFMRRAEEGFVIVVLNFTPVVRSGYRVGAPEPGVYQEIFNSDAAVYGGSNQGNLGRVVAEPFSWMNRRACLTLTLPPLAGIVLGHVPT
ncbi:MAG: 1,4-alpha-glucan branching enzyme [Gammaproteobacteria bacterium RIFCSPLOWO2_02_FULL_61_13]|nr:MAG: 1,4-alpha-glucan branching enzyme [Gammaproteobacteria bacterium RIFCSPLOWO2_02_FULL_61_13]